jgi:hypothetical protein
MFTLQVQPFQVLSTLDLSVTRFRYSQNFRTYDVLPDAKYYAVIRNGAQTATVINTQPPEIKVVLNWFEELKKLVPNE